MERKLAIAVRNAFAERAMQVLCLCASLSPALAGLPHLMEYVWTYMTSVWHPTPK